MMLRKLYLSRDERQTLDLTCHHTLRRRKDRVKRILGFILGNRFGFGA